ncbi:cobyric acid synthase [Halovenus rubra]|uniref:Cobyric acid synthase n=2 Tax=Halovenus rubra TaxID=869890 RepID=A0ACC7E3C2_9EURY|nr:cobyric acid synthase [Halovenus rubra]
MATTLLVAGTASHVGKSTVVAGLARLLASHGVDVAPFKGQNMSNNARAVLTPNGSWGEMGVSQYVQARAADVAPTTDHNPVLLKPRGDSESQLVIDGQAVGHYEAGTYYETHWDDTRKAAKRAHARLAEDHDVILAEGAGSIAEINLHDRDLANIETARFADASILLVGDIERGGAFASLYGTLELLPADIRRRVEGIVITKFRGDPDLLDPGIDELEAKTGVPVVGVLPYDDPGLPAEDSVSLPAEGNRKTVGEDSQTETVTVGVVRLPHISNFTDFEPLARVPGVQVTYLPVEAEFGAVDALVLPGTKNTVDDLLALREAGVGEAVASFSGPIVGICGGYQMLGEQITNAGIESTVDRDTVSGFGLLPVKTRFQREKRVQEATVSVDGTGPINGATGSVTGYEIHMGQSEPLSTISQPLGEQSAVHGSVLGTYLHGLFENRNVRSAFVETVANQAGVDRSTHPSTHHSPYDRARDLVTEIEQEWFETVFPEAVTDMEASR